MKSDTFSQYHPVVNFLFFLGAMGMGVVIQHPAYTLAGCAAGGAYYLLLHGRKGLRLILRILPLTVLIAGTNPLFNTYGSRVLFTVFQRPYTLEALYYGMIIAGMFVTIMLWFGCYNAVLTCDKFTSLFGNLIPSISLLIVMVLRMIPNFIRKAKQIADSRRCIGKGADAKSSKKEKLMDGVAILSALTDWALEGSVVTGDSMRARGYGSGKRTSFQIYHMKNRDCITLLLMLILILFVITAGGTSATYTPQLSIAPLSWGFCAYCVFVLIPTALHIREAIRWHVLISNVREL